MTTETATSSICGAEIERLISWKSASRSSLPADPLEGAVDIGCEPDQAPGQDAVDRDLIVAAKTGPLNDRDSIFCLGQISHLDL